eukprot:763490-Hanusia_phi.AAC.4
MEGPRRTTPTYQHYEFDLLSTTPQPAISTGSSPVFSTGVWTIRVPTPNIHRKKPMQTSGTHENGTAASSTGGG